MSYTGGESAILARIQAHADYSTSNTDQNDWSKLNGGKSAYYAILKPGADPAAVEFITPLQYVANWTTTVECWRRFVDEHTTPAALFADVNKIIGQVQAYPTLGLSYVQVSRVTSITAPAFRWVENGPTWLVQEVNITWREETTATYV